VPPHAQQLGDAPLPTAYSFGDLFWTVEREALPQFEPLLRLGRELTYQTGPLNSAQHTAASKAFNAISTVCRQNGFRPLVLELALVADERTLADRESPYFASYLRADGPASEEMLWVYAKALDVMKNDPMVPHREFYEQALFVAPVGTPRDLPKSTLAFLDSSETLRGLQYGFKKNVTQQTAPGDRVLTYVKGFREHLATKFSSDSAEHALFLQSVFVVLPLIRPYYRSSAGLAPRRDDADALHTDQAMGGMLFGFVVPSFDLRDPSLPSLDPATPFDQALASGLKHLGRNLLAVVSVSGLRESYSQLDGALRFKDLVSNMSHGAITAIGSIRSEELALALTGGERTNDPDELVPFLNVLLKDPVERGHLLRALNHVFLGEDTATALISFAEISADDGVVRPKFLAKKHVPFRHLVQEAAQMVEQNARGAAKLRATELDWRHDADATIPPGYLDGRILRGIVAEILLNASKHGKPTDGVISVRVSVAKETDCAVCIFENDAVDTSIRAGNLMRMQRIIKAIDGLDLEVPTSGPSGVFRVTLRLGAIRVEGTTGMPLKSVPVRFG